MKAIISYGSYFNRGQKYHVQFIYEDKSEAEEISRYIENFNGIEPIYPHYSNFTIDTDNNKFTGIEKTNIPEKDLLSFIKTLITEHNGIIIINNQEFTTYEEDKIKETLEKLHIIASLKKDNYFDLGEQYYITFKYATDEQRNEISFEFINNLSTITSNLPIIGSNNLCPFQIDKNGKLTIENTGIIGGTNIPENLFAFLLKRFVEIHHMILVVGEEKFKDRIDSKKFYEALATISPTEKGRPRTRKKPTIQNQGV